MYRISFCAPKYQFEPARTPRHFFNRSADKAIEHCGIFFRQAERERGVCTSGAGIRGWFRRYREEAENGRRKRWTIEVLYPPRARRCRVSVIRDSVRANLARAGRKIIHRLPARDITRAECAELNFNGQRETRGQTMPGRISCFERSEEDPIPAVLRHPRI